MPNVKKNAMSHAFLTIHKKICLLHNIKRDTHYAMNIEKEGVPLCVWTLYGQYGATLYYLNLTVF